MTTGPLFYANVLWIVFLIVWLLAAVNVKRSVTIQSRSSRAIQTLFLIPGCMLIFFRAFAGSVLGTRLLPFSAGLPYAGLLLTIAGIAFAFWARFFLGRNWSSNVTLKQDHELICSGPYRIVRHPIYSGLLLALLGTALIVNALRAYLGVVLCAVGLHLKAAVEEEFMVRQFGGEYGRYRQRTKALIPFVL